MSASETTTTVAYYVADNGVGAAMERAPDWLVKFLYFPPEWAVPAVGGAIVVLLVGAVLGLHRYGLDDDTAWWAAENLAILFATGVLAAGLARVGAPFWFAAFCGWLGGYILGRAARRWLEGEVRESRRNDATQGDIQL